MADLSFKCWHLAVNCDHPAHRRTPPPPGHNEEPDFYTVEPDRSKREWRARWRANGFTFHRDGRVTCPECSRKTKAPTIPGEE